MLVPPTIPLGAELGLAEAAHPPELQVEHGVKLPKPPFSFHKGGTEA